MMSSLEDRQRLSREMSEAARREWMRDYSLNQEAKSELIKMRVTQFVEEIGKGLDHDDAAKRMLIDLGVLPGGDH
ncbi:hypothetical protein EOA27_06045 [Mesorhizobium sp. M2A.F.Ca.ET.037.01.1.1]|uniref:hypothetical protein n=1 Tax=unclassified Mesorhizobium TaxID=325217 RepID=UPI000FCA2B7A|nr:MULTISPECIES: hypothetical protein [unclassified Mesorhizobium]RUX21435.1 hypothetical protein EOA27_06045 [Mesorhizobium sp. M2A.F.Ca.ET.037.01.1.1]RUY12197.1 hypothetical protein EOA25_03965 [Mesorhizobium sp. M2A.F.Ca.ET.040.01.1.1]RWA90959.1 MAG: hypothetical protein EOQ31_12220 [Mesorhizobium sp.]TIV19800.1 MAG: hypothetical protein E5V95_07160 [Mesorhizobium sp.]